jgi:UDP-glucose:glycoprotein glucosyltransferase
MSVRETVVLLVVGIFAGVWASSKPVHITLTSNWTRTPILLEASEFLSGEDPLLFWEFLEKTEDLHLAETERDVYEAVMDQAEQLLPPLVFNCLQLSLSLHTQSPAVTMYQQLAEERQSSLGGGDCLPWAELGGRAYCSINDLTSDLGPDTPTSQPEIYSFDHVYPTPLLSGNKSSQVLPVAILYCQLGTEPCLHWHHQLAGLASLGSLRYVFRHHFQVEEEGGTVLSGYGVQLAVKNSEYKAVDDTKVEGEGEVEEGEEEVELDIQGFSFPTLQSLHKDLSEKLEEFRQHLQHSSREIPDLKAWQVQDLGFQAAQRVASSPPDMALSVLRDLVQNLPTMTRTLSRVAVKKDLRSEVISNQRSLQKYGMEPGDSVVLFNGIVLQTESTDTFSVLEVLLAESHLIGGLTGLGLSVSDAHSVVQIPVHSQAQSFAVDMRSQSVVFINDLESDKHYAGWSKSLKQFMQPTFPGSLRQVARNVFNLVFCLDPASMEGIELLEYMALFLENQVPVRLGVLLVSGEDNEVGVAISRGFYYIVENHSGREALNWLLEVQSNLTVEAVKFLMETEFPDAPADIFADTSSQEEKRKEAVAFFGAKGLRSLPQVLLNGVQLDLEEEDLEAAIVNQLQQQTYLLQRWIYMKKVTDYTDVYEYFMTRPNVLQRLNHHITATDSLNLDLSATLPVPIPELSQFHSLGSLTMSALLAHHMTYYTGPKDEFAVRSVSLWVVADLDSEQGRLAAHSALSYLAESSAVQVGFLHNPLTGSGGGGASDLVRSVVAAELRGWATVSLLLSLLSSSSDSPLTLLAQQVSKGESEVEEAVSDGVVETVIAARTVYCRRVLGLRGGQTAILANGRLVGPLEEDESFSEQDYSMLVQLDNSSYAHAVAEAVGDVAVGGVSPDGDTSAFRSRLVLKVSSLLRSQPQQRRIPRPSLKDKHRWLCSPNVV